MVENTEVTSMKSYDNLSDIYNDAISVRYRIDLYELLGKLIYLLSKACNKNLEI